MAPKRESDKTVVDRLVRVFRTEGFEGSSLSRLRDATGLGRSSLYHRFPNGKVDMASAALQAVADHFQREIFQPARDIDNPEDQITHIAEGLRSFYADGELSCLLDTMTLGSTPGSLVEESRSAMNTWIAEFARISTLAGATADDAAGRATDAVAAIEGALVVGRTTGDTDSFNRAVHSLQERLL